MNSVSLPDNTLLQFKLIHDFIESLFTQYGTRNRGLALYYRLITKTTISHKDAVNKHCNIFKTFCSDNSDAISEQNVSDMTQPIISYSENVKFNLVTLLNIEKDNSVIWDHLLTISAVLDPLSRAKQILKDRKKSNSGGGGDFLSDIVSQIEKSIKPGSDPMDAIGSVLSSGVLTDIMSKMGDSLQDGSMDLGGLVGGMQNMLAGSNNNEQSDGDNTTTPDLSGMLNMLAGSMNKSGDGNNAAPDLSGMMNMLSCNPSPELPSPIPPLPPTNDKKDN